MWAPKFMVVLLSRPVSAELNQALLYWLNYGIVLHLAFVAAYYAYVKLDGVWLCFGLYAKLVLRVLLYSVVLLGGLLFSRTVIFDYCE